MKKFSEFIIDFAPVFFVFAMGFCIGGIVTIYEFAELTKNFR